MRFPFQKIAGAGGKTQTSAIFAKHAGKPRIEGQFLKNLGLFEKGKLTSAEDEFQGLFHRDSDTVLVPHKEMPWLLYRESYRRIPLVYNAINNTADFALQAGFELEGSNDAQQKIWKWIDKTNFNLILRNIFIQMQAFGNPYLDITETDFPKLLPPDNMFVIAEKGGGRVVGWKQVNSLDESRNVAFSPGQLIHFKWNDAINPFYGLSEIHPALGAITRYENFALDVGDILHRYSAPIIHWTVGTEEMPPTQEQIDDFRGDVENRLVGEDFVTSAGIKPEVLGAGQKMMQVDGLILMMQNDIIAALRVPEIFARGGATSNKATAQVELEAFDRKVRALQQAVSTMLEDFLFPKLTSGDVRIVWNELSIEGELIRAQRLQSYITSGVPLEIGLKMSGLGTWVDDVKKAVEEELKAGMQAALLAKSAGGKPGKPGEPEETPKDKFRGKVRQNGEKA